MVFDCIRAGETYDAGLEMPRWNEPNFNDSRWKPAVPLPAPKGRLSAQMEPPLRVTEIRKPVKLSEPKPGVYLFDLGVNLTGWVRFEAQGEPRAEDHASSTTRCSSRTARWIRRILTATPMAATRPTNSS